jgi:peptidoglycan/LPS O-acetylase OafA/YrhL
MTAQLPVAGESAISDAASLARRYHPQLDGLRAIAVLIVVTHHAVLPLAPFGYVGVDIFFVLSGYLITSILLDEYRRRGSVRLGRFYLRRFIRLYPALIVCAALVAIPGVLLGSSGWLHVKSTVFALLYLTPITRTIDPNSAGVWSHTWSLGIEEMFYLVWPLMLLVFLRRGLSLRTILIVTAAIGMVLVTAYVVFDGGPARLFLRAGGIFIGCALAVALAFLKPRIPQVLGWVALAYILTLTVAGQWFFPGQAVPGVILATVVLISVMIDGRNSRGLTRVLSTPVLVYLGKISYEIYLWHFVILSLGMWAYGREATMMDVAWWAVPVSLALAAGTHALVAPVADTLRTRFASR